MSAPATRVSEGSIKGSMAIKHRMNKYKTNRIQPEISWWLGRGRLSWIRFLARHRAISTSNGASPEIQAGRCLLIRPDPYVQSGDVCHIQSGKCPVMGLEKAVRCIPMSRELASIRSGGREYC